MHLHFNSISEPTLAGPKWQKLFNTHWADYLAWLDADKATNFPSLATSQAALRKHMPEMLPTYEHLCQVVNADELVARFLTGFQPPTYISGCSQAVLTEGKPKLVRNYDYHPDLLEGALLMSAWNGKKVIANSDCLIGALDGMNEDGLVISLTFGGRKAVGEGFGIPFILRYILEFCSNVEEAVAALSRIPSHNSYNVTVLDKSGAFKTIHLAPDREPLITEAAFITNHQETVEWTENAQFNKTIERADFLENLLLDKTLDEDKLVHSFLSPPLYNTQFNEGFGTLYTAAYCPVEGSVQLYWPNLSLKQSFDDFKEGNQSIPLNVSAPTPAAVVKREPFPEEKVQPSIETSHQSHIPQAERDIKTDVPPVPPEANQDQLETGPENSVRQGRTLWEAIADYWSNI